MEKIKVKVLDSTDAGVLETEVNSFILNKEIIDIKYQTSSQHKKIRDGVMIGTMFSAMIIYKQ